MMNTIKIIILVSLLIAGLAGCTGLYKKLDPGTDFGSPPVNYEQTIKEYFELTLKDPESAKYRFKPPIKAYANDAGIRGGGIAWHGWIVQLHINARNSFGGYTGFKPHTVFFDGNTIRKHIKSHGHGLLHKLSSN